MPYTEIRDLSDFTKSLGFNHQSGEAEASMMFDFVRAVKMDETLKAKMEEAEIEVNDLRKDFLEKWFPFWQKLTEQLWARRLLTFEDQKYWALNFLDTNSNVQREIRSRKITHLFVDEFQDINMLDLYFIQSIVRQTGVALTIVGDDDQCIYEWRGCTSAFIRKPERSFRVNFQRR